MLLYILICLSLSLAGVAGLQFLYLFYLDRIDKERKKRIHELEIQCKSLTYRLRQAEARIEQQTEALNSFYEDEEGEEAWADVIEDR